jgi:hypothetical protein
MAVCSELRPGSQCRRNRTQVDFVLERVRRRARLAATSVRVPDSRVVEINLGGVAIESWELTHAMAYHFARKRQNWPPEALAPLGRWVESHLRAGGPRAGRAGRAVHRRDEGPGARLKVDCDSRELFVCWGEACCLLADQYDRGKWVKSDAAKAAELRAQACGARNNPAVRTNRDLRSAGRGTAPLTCRQSLGERRSSPAPGWTR